MLLNISITHIQPRIYGFSYTVSLFGSSQRMDTYLGGKELQLESRRNVKHGSTKQFKSAYKEVEMAWLHHVALEWTGSLYLACTLTHQRNTIWLFCLTFASHKKATNSNRTQVVRDL